MNFINIKGEKGPFDTKIYISETGQRIPGVYRVEIVLDANTSEWYAKLYCHFPALDLKNIPVKWWSEKRRGWKSRLKDFIFGREISHFPKPVVKTGE